MVLEKVKAILSEQFDVEEDTITPETLIADDEFEIEIPDEEIDNIKTVGELVKYIEEHA